MQLQRKIGGTAITLALLTALLTPTAQGYYHFVHYITKTSGYQQIREKFDLNALVNNTVTYVISDAGLTKLAPGDSFNSLISQIHLAAKTWSSVPTSQLHLAFGGLAKAGAPASTPEIEIVFGDVPPGLLATGGPTTRGDLSGPDDAKFVPILKSTIVLPNDLSSRPSWTDAMFLTLTHELGHTLGLQHTKTSSVMSTELTRAVTKGAPLTEDDRAGVSTLYPTPNFAASFGTITGRITAGADGMNLASVIAMTTDGLAVGALTNPDGSYRIEGIPPGNYFVYAHPLPPALTGESFPDNVIPPTELGGTPFPSSGAFNSVFFPGVQQADNASVVNVKAGAVSDKVDFQVTRRANVPVFGITTYSYPNGVAVKPAFLSPSYQPTLVAAGTGLLGTNGDVASGLNISVIGNSAAISSVTKYTPPYLRIDLQLHPIPGEGARHMIFRKDGDMHVLPAAFRLVSLGAPTITEIAPVTDDAGLPFTELRGSGFTADSRVYFDGAPASIASISDKALRVTPPPASSGYKASVIVVNPDGQSSLFATGAPQVFTYGNVTDASISASTNTLTPGVETFVDVRAAGMSFNASTTLAFGSADIIVRRQWLLGSDRIVANVITTPGATPGKANLVATSGLRAVNLPDGIQIGDTPARAASVASAIVDDATGRPAISPGFTARVRLKDVAANLTAASFTIRVSGVAATPVSFGDSVLIFRIPTGLGPGPAITDITAAGEPLPSILTAVDLPPPVITGVSAGSAAPAATATVGDVITLRVLGLIEGRDPIDASRLQVLVGGLTAKVVGTAVAPQGHDIQIELDAKQPAGPTPVIILIEGRPSAPFNIVVK